MARIRKNPETAAERKAREVWESNVILDDLHARFGPMASEETQAAMWAELHRLERKYGKVKV